MAVSEHVDTTEADQSFLGRSYLTYMVPFATNLKLEEALRHPDGPSKAVEQLQKREWLFFDETIDVYMIFRTPYAEAKHLQASLSKVSISIEVRVVNNNATDRGGSPPASEIIHTGIVDEGQEPFIAYDEEESDREDGDEEQERYAYAVWKLPIFLSRPRIRIQSPSVVFQAAASVRVSDAELTGGLKRGYLQSGVPSGLNLLESFSGDPALQGIKPRLSALRVSRVAPVTTPADQQRPIKGLQSLTLKIYPAVHTRVRFARPNTTPPSPALIALLEVDFTPFSDCESVLDKITMSVTDGQVEDLNTQPGLSLPLACVAHDHVTLLYRLTPSELDIISRNPTRDLDISISVRILLSPNLCTPTLTMAWTTTLDFTLPVNPGFGQPITQPIQRSHRPSQLSIGSSNISPESQSLISPRVSRPDALPSLEASAARNTEVPLPEFGITMTFTAPDRPVRAGEEFAWSVFVVNRSRPEPPAVHADPTASSSGPTTTVSAPVSAPAATTPAPARKLALFAIPRRPRRADAPPRAAPARQHQQQKETADAVLDEAVVHAVQRGGSVEGTDIVCLSADVRVGPLAPEACAVVELRFLALRTGVLGVEAVRVVDLASQEHVDVRELPVVVVVD
ncbi:TRAPP trafficking subunit Trs65-domain-containing protein [Coniochaeta sp. 2T2.1]|nr:TRAPP trafficking subunit Trs65-domain-containing protein [Coniochaeta sp. 2T2.1]